MFQSARLKLTIWYVLISLVVSIIFSLTVYTLLARELQRNEQRLEGRLQLMRGLNPGFRPNFEMHRQDLALTESAVRWYLVYVNLFILLMTSAAGYLLAGRTLSPIKTMVDKQNQFVADASHELRTPLTALKTAVEVSLRDKNLDIKQAKEVLNANLEDVNRLVTLADELLILATLNTVKKQLLEELSLTQVIQDAIKSVKYLGKQKQVKIETTLSEISLVGDRERLLKMLVIFLDNAIKYSPAKSVIRVTAIKTDSKAQVSISDQGAGIGAKDLPHIFERFYRADKSRSKTKVEGYGLGLAIAKEILDLYKGTVAVESRPGQGTTFTIHLPLKIN